MINNLPLTRNDVKEIIKHNLINLDNIELMSIVNTFTNSWVRLNPETHPTEFTWMGGERPNYLESVKDFDRIRKVREEIRKETLDNSE